MEENSIIQFCFCNFEYKILVQILFLLQHMKFHKEIVIFDFELKEITNPFGFTFEIKFSRNYNGYIITWILQQIFMFSKEVKLVRLK